MREGNQNLPFLSLLIIDRVHLEGEEKQTLFMTTDVDGRDVKKHYDTKDIEIDIDAQ